MRSRARKGYTSVLVAALTVLLLTPSSLLRQGEAMQDGVTRSLTLAVARPVSAISGALHLEEAASAVLTRLHIGSGPEAGNGTPLLLRKDLTLPPPVPPQALHQGRDRQGDAPRSGGGTTRGAVGSGGGTIDPRLLEDPPRLRPTAAHPLRLLITGDSLVGYLGPQLANSLAGTGVVRSQVDVHNGTGLTRPFFVDWASLAAQQVSRYHPDATVVMLGANDDIGMPLPNGHVAAEGSAQWAAEYERRLEIVMGILSQRGRAPVLWLSLPMAREARRSHDYALINAAAREAARAVPSMRVVEVGERFTPGGHYRDSMPTDGRNRIVRQADGIHLNVTGSRLAADLTLNALRRVYDLPRV
jgi:lysophospholipase L1-like esterase